MSLSIAHILEVPLQKCPATLIRPAVQEKLRLSRSNALLLVDFNERNIYHSMTGRNANEEDYDYWQDKIADWASVKIPVYQTAGWSHFHLPGSINAWRRCKSRRKWLRIHRDFEWPDTYTPENLEDLKRFYDRYLKDIHNGWEMTPKVRVDVMDAFDLDHADRRPETSFPLERTQYKKLYGHTLSGFQKPVADSSRGSSVEEMTGDIAMVVIAAANQ